MTDSLQLTAVDFDPFGDGKKIEKVILTNEPQREIWLSCLIGGREANLSFNESVSLQLTGRLDQNALKRAIDSVILRHESLRSTISPDGEKLIIYNDFAVDFPFEDISQLTEEEKIDYIAIFKHKALYTEFDLNNGPLFNASLQKLNDSEHLFTIVQHHIISDGWSTGLILEDISKFYNAYSKGKTIYLEKPAQISDYIVLQKNFIASDEHQQTEDFWLKLYQNNAPQLNLITDYPRLSPRTYAGNRLDFKLPITLIDNIKSIGSKAGCSLVTTLLAAFEIFLHKKTNQNDIVVGLPSSGQSAFELYDLVGHCVNLLPLKTSIDSKKSFNDYLQKRKSEVLDAYDYQKLTFGELIQKLYIPRDPSRITLVPVVFNIDLGMTSAVSFDDLEFTLSSNPRGFEHFEIFLNATGSQDNFTLEWSYNIGLFKSETIEKFNAEYINIIEKIAINPDELISSLIQKEVAEVIMGPEIPIVKNVLELLKEAVGKYSEKVAVTYKDNSLTYLELNYASNKVARYLIENGVQIGDVVALSTHRGIEMVITLLGIMKSGATYLPVDPDFPKNRVEYMLSDSSAKILLVSEKYKHSFHSNTTQIVIEELLIKLNGCNVDLSSSNVSFNDIAYLLYTSGSTGMPKGTRITHKNFANFVSSMLLTPGIHANDKILAITTISFDISYLELIVPLAAGAEIIIANTEEAKDGQILLEIIEDQNITVLQATPSRWQMLLDCGWNKKYKLKVFTGGEPLSAELAGKLLDRSSEVWNMYAPTETTIYSIVKHITNSNKQISIGLPIQNTSVYILDEEEDLVPHGAVGEICISGDGVADGYLNQPILTDEKFVTDPFTTRSVKMYKTGDLGKISDEGEIICLGRKDNQVKIRGFRIELGEIESSLTKQKGLKQAVVLAKEDYHDDKKLIAYLIIDPNIIEIELSAHQQKYPSEEVISNWKNNLRKDLPEYMLPGYFIVLDAFPLTPNGKVDRMSLPSIQEKFKHPSKHIDLTENEKLIAEIWSKLLGVQNLVPSDDFFKLGGHSLIAVKGMMEIERKTGIRLPLAVLFEHSTLEKLARQLDKQNQSHGQWQSLIPIKKSGNKPPLYFVHGSGMNIIVFKSLTDKIDHEQPIYGLQPRGLNPDEEPFETVEDIANGYVVEILEANPDGPYLLLGYSAGGTIALEMVNQLQKIGKEVAFVGLLDTFYDGETYWEMIKKFKIIEIFSYTIQSIGYALVSLFRYPKAYVEHKAYFIYGTMYNYYKKLNPIKKDLSNPTYVLNKIQKAHENALQNYKIKAINADVHLFQASDKIMTYIPNMDSNGWAPYVKGKLIKINLPLEHLQFFHPDYVGTFVEILENALKSIQTIKKK